MADHAVVARLFAVAVERAAQDEVLAAQMRAVETAADSVEYLVDAEGLEQKIRGAGLQGPDGGVEIGKGGDQDHLAVEAGFAYLVQPVHPALARHRVVENDQVEVLLLEQATRFVGRGGGLHHVAARLQCALQKAAHARLVIDDEDGAPLPAAEGIFTVVACCGLAHGLESREVG